MKKRHEFFLFFTALIIFAILVFSFAEIGFGEGSSSSGGDSYTCADYNTCNCEDYNTCNCEDYNTCNCEDYGSGCYTCCDWGSCGSHGTCSYYCDLSDTCECKMRDTCDDGSTSLCENKTCTPEGCNDLGQWCSGSTCSNVTGVCSNQTCESDSRCDACVGKTCDEGCLCTDGSCSNPLFNDSASCSPSSKLAESCDLSVNIHELSNLSKNLFNGTSSCLQDVSCSGKSYDDIGSIENCQFNCYNGGTNSLGCYHRYCLDLDKDGFANNLTCQYGLTNPTVNNVRTDFSYVLYNTTTMSWTDANQSCVTQGGSLVHVVDSEVKNILDEKFSGQNYWIGLNDRYVEGNFNWVNGEILYKNTYWGIITVLGIDYQQPDNSGLGEDCVETMSNGNWNDASCSQTKAYVCEFPYVFDCDDSHLNVHPGAEEICDGKDNNCNGQIDEGCVVVKNASWTNLITKDYEIPSADPQDTVLMNSNASSGGLNYTVKTMNFCVSNCEIRLDNLGSVVPLVLIDRFSSFYFNVASASLNWVSKDLTMTSKENNSWPFAEITSPGSQSNFTSGGNVPFSANVYDADDFLNVSWDFGDGNSSTINNYAKAIDGASGVDTTHNYSSCGLFNVKLAATETDREHYVEVSHDVFVYKEGICVFGVISSPENERYNYTNLVLFNASGSFVTNCSKQPMANSFQVGNLNCVYVHKPGQQEVSQGYSLFVEWFIDNVRKESKVWGQGLSDGYGAGLIQEFYRWFGVASHHTAQLKLTFSTD